MQAIHRSLADIHSLCSILAVAEADYRRSPDLEEYDFSYMRKAWAVKRKKLAGGRAMKLFVTKELEPAIDSVVWLDRSVVLRLKSALDSVQFIFTHFAHGDDWDGSVEELMPWLRSSGWRSVVLGDMNIECREASQTGLERQRWHSMTEQFSSHSLVQREVGLEFTHLGDHTSAESAHESKIDHVFCNGRLAFNVAGTWEQALGDHCFLLFDVAFRVQWRKQPPRRWHCNWPAFQEFVDLNSPDLFGAWSTAEEWMLQAIELHSIRRSRRERRRAWEPFCIKLLRHRINRATSESERNRLSKQLFSMRKRHAQERELVSMRGVASKGRNIWKRSNNLFPVIGVESGGSFVTASLEVADAVRGEFERRWSSLPADLEPDFLSASYDSNEFALSVEDVLTAAKALKRPWMRDCRGIPAACIFASEAFVQAVLPCLKSLLSSDTDWLDLWEQGYVKQKDSGGKLASRLRGIIPNSTVLRLLTFIVKRRVEALCEEFSREHALDSRVLGASRGGQPLDIAGAGMLVLQCARDDEDRGAVGHIDIGNYHDSMSRYELWKSMRRRNIASSLCSAALRLQRCPIVTLCVRDTSTGPIERTRGALTGNSLAPLFGRILVEDVFIAAHCLTDPLAYRFLDAVVHPMAWSDNVVVFGNSVRRTAKCLSILSDHLESKFLRVKEGSGEIVPASSRKLLWRPVKAGPHAYAVVAESRVLGYHLACNGDTSRNRGAMIGGLRGSMHRMSEHFARVPVASRAFWWKMQFRGILGFHAAFVGCSSTIFKELGVVGNAGARKVAGLVRRHNNDLTAVKANLNICVQTFYAKCIVRFLGHAFRHVTHPFTQLLSLPLPGRLASLRSHGRESAASDLAQTTFSFLSHLGFSLDPPTAGPLNIRGHSGYVCRWGEGWFWVIKDGGPGWSFEKTDEAAINFRIQLLLDMFAKSRSSLPNFLVDFAPLPLEDG